MALRRYHVALVVMVIVCLAVGCGDSNDQVEPGDDAPLEERPIASMPTEIPGTATSVPTRGPVTGPVPAASLPFPDVSEPRPTRTPRATVEPVTTPVRRSTPSSGSDAEKSGSDVSKILTSVRENGLELFTYGFRLDGMIVADRDGKRLEIPVNYSGEAMLWHNAGTLELDTDQELDVIAVHGMYFGSDEYDIETAYVFDKDMGAWNKESALLGLTALTDVVSLVGSDQRPIVDGLLDSSEIVLEGREDQDGVETHVLRGEIPRDEGLLEVTCWISVGNNSVRRLEVSGELGLDGLESVFTDYDSFSSVDITVLFEDYGRDVDYEIPELIGGRFEHGVVLLEGGRVLMSGGFTGPITGFFPSFPHFFTEMYDPDRQTWRIVERMWSSEYFPQGWTFVSPAAVLPDGRVLAGAARFDEDDSTGILVEFDPGQGDWGEVSEMPLNWLQPSIVSVGDGLILVSSRTRLFDGFMGIDDMPGGAAYLYDVDSGEWSESAQFTESMDGRTMVVTSEGIVMAVGGRDDGRLQRRVDIFDPASNVWTRVADMYTGREMPEVIGLMDGRVLVTGGLEDRTNIGMTSRPPHSEIYDPAEDRWAATGSMLYFREDHTLTLLPDGRVLAAGGYDGDGSEYEPYATTEIYDPKVDSWLVGPELVAARSGHAAILMPDDRVFMVAGVNPDVEGYPGISTEYVEVP